MQYKSKWGTVDDLELNINSYLNNNSLFLELIDKGGEYSEPYGSITVNLGDSVPVYCAYVDTNDMPEVEQFIRENELGEFTEFEMQNGFCTYPLYFFDPDKLRELCPDGLAEYEKANGIEPEIEELKGEEPERSR